MEEIMITKSYKYKIYPNKKQEKLIQKTFGCTRFVYNYFLNLRIEKYKNNNELFSNILFNCLYYNIKVKNCQYII